MLRRSRNISDSSGLTLRMTNLGNKVYFTHFDTYIITPQCKKLPKYEEMLTKININSLVGEWDFDVFRLFGV